MRCLSCDYQNPRGTTVCVECGIGLDGDARRDAQVQFQRQLGTTVRRAQERYERSSLRNGDDPSRSR